jgi:P pilus assembly chaperone PapD
MFSIFTRGAILSFGMLFAVHAHAGIVLNATRVIYEASDKEVSLGVHNTGTGEILAQSWMETVPPTPEGVSLPFVITPALARMAGNGRQLLRIIYAGSGLPQDRESVLWINVQEIPQQANENALQIAIRQRLKVFFRPQGLTGDPLKATEALQWQRVEGGQLEVNNPTPYHVSMIKLDVRQGGTALLEEESRMLAPMQRIRLPLKESSNGSVELKFTSINDFGAQASFKAQVESSRPSQAHRIEPRPDSD